MLDLDDVIDFAFLDRFLARRRAIMVTIAAAFGVMVLASGAGEPVDNGLHAMRDAVRAHAASGQVQIIEIDARSIAAIHSWPWPRHIHAQAIDRLLKADVKTIAFDVDFSSLSSPGEDRKLADALDRAGGNVILPTFRQEAGSGSTAAVDSLPAQPFAGKAFLGAVTVIPDRDGYVRRMPLGVETGGLARPSLASLLAEARAQSGRSFPIDFSIRPDSIPRHSYLDLIEGRVPASALAGKRVIIGATAVELGDRYAVPGHGVIPGVVIQSLAAETLLKGVIPRDGGAVLPFALALLVIWLCARRSPRPLRVTLFAGGTVAILLLPLAAEAWLASSFEIVPALATLGGAGLVALTGLLAEGFRERVLTDAATGLGNVAALELDARKHRPAMVVVGRIDRFAAIASGLGAEATTRLVLRVAERLSFANEGRTIYRTDDASLAWMEWAGDERTTTDRLEALLAVMRAPVDCGRLIDVTLNLGLADVGLDAKQLVVNASLASTHAAKRGLRWERFNVTNSEETEWHLSLLGELDAAMASGQVWNSYQPKLDMKTGRVLGAEALVRWLHPQRGPIAPDDFMPLVEEHGRARDLTLHVLIQALEDAVQWDGIGRAIGVAVNVSATLLGDEEFIEQVRQMLRQSPIPPERVTIEITETAAIQSAAKALDALDSWRALGVNVSIDDYGTGQSSLGYLQKLPATELKIDKSFVMTVNEDQRNAIMVRSTIALAHELGMKVVAEGIENAACLQTLKDMGCDIGQGFYIGRPMSAANLSVFLGASEQAA